MHIRMICRSKGFWAMLLVMLWPGLVLAAGEFSSMTAVISKKVKENVGMIVAKDGSSERITILVEGRPYHIAENTKIIDKGGKEIPIARLSVPCEARIMYQPVQTRDPYVSKVTVRKLLPGASSAWPEPAPQ